MHFFVQTGADIDAKDYAGNTCLHNAVLWGDINIVFFLMECGADAKIRNSWGKKTFAVNRTQNI